MKTLSEWQGSLYIVFCILTFCVGMAFWRKEEEIKEIPRFPKDRIDTCIRSGKRKWHNIS